MTRTHIVHAVSNLLSVGLLTVFLLMFLALLFGCQAPATHDTAADVAPRGQHLLAPAPADATPPVTSAAR
jgi:hypothetical protein